MKNLIKTYLEFKHGLPYVNIDYLYIDNDDNKCIVFYYDNIECKGVKKYDRVSLWDVMVYINTKIDVK